ncbi:MAG: MarR family winged helix-turn-helix transcriptional regulator [Eubacterium sp.]
MKDVYDELVNEFVSILLCAPKISPRTVVDDMGKGEMMILGCCIGESKKNGNITPGEISTFTGVSSARVAVVLNNLEKKGYIVRESDLNDRRKIIVRVTQYGMEYANAKMQEGIKMLKNIFEAIGEDDAREFVRIVKKMHDNTKDI